MVFVVVARVVVARVVGVVARVVVVVVVGVVVVVVGVVVVVVGVVVGVVARVVVAVLIVESAGKVTCGSVSTMHAPNSSPAIIRRAAQFRIGQSVEARWIYGTCG